MIENIKSLLYKIALMILFIVFAKSCVSDYINGSDKEKTSQLNQMIEENTFVQASLSKNYTQTSIAKIVKIYKFDYSFNLNGQEYSGKISLNELPNTNILKLYYLKEDPKIISADPSEELKSENEKGKSISDLLIGILWGILAVLLFISLLSAFKKKKELENSDNKLNEKKSHLTEIKKDFSEDEKKLNDLEKEQIQKEKEDPNRFMPK
jgi:uncharacterized membrane protein YhiD involved in acid resistance